MAAGTDFFGIVHQFALLKGFKFDARCDFVPQRIAQLNVLTKVLDDFFHFLKVGNWDEKFGG